VTFVVCPNLSIDRVLRADVMRLGGLTRCHALAQQAGGKGANVLRAVLALGGAPSGAGTAGAGTGGGGDAATCRSVLAGFAAGRGGRLIADLAADEKLPLTAVDAPGEARVSTVVLTDDGSVTRLYEEGPRIGPREERALLTAAGARPAARGEWAVVDGAAPPGASPGFYAALCGALRASGYLVMVDADGEQLTHALEAAPDLVKVNLSEACSAVGEPGAHCEDEKLAAHDDLAAEGLELARRLVAVGAREALVTLGAAGAVGLAGGAEWRLRTPPVHAVNPVGSGDCFAGALALALERGDALRDALALAVGAAAANAAHPLTGHVEPALAAELAGAASVGPPDGSALSPQAPPA
jgi:fructose-1-phosphate kinase PfkB-like protein